MKNRNLIILMFTLIVVMMGFGMVIPILAFYVDSFGASGRELGLLMGIYAMMQFIFAPVWGGISDRIGRKPVLIIGILGNALSQLFFGFATELWMLFAARILAGLLSSASLPTAMAYISDSTSDEDRGGGMGMLGAAMGIGMVIGPGLGGWLGADNLSRPFFVASGLSFLALVLIFILVPESLPESKRTGKTRLKGPELQLMWQALFGPIGILLVIAFLLSFGLTNFEGIFSLFALERYGYGTREVGIILTGIGLTSAIMQGAMTGVLSKRFGEIWIIRASFIGSALGFLLMLTARNFIEVLLTACLFVLSNALLRPSVSSLTSKWSDTGHGVSLGLNNAFMSLGRMTGPVWAGFVFDYDMRLPYFTGALVMVVGFGISLAWLKYRAGKVGEISVSPGSSDYG